MADYNLPAVQFESQLQQAIAHNITLRAFQSVTVNSRGDAARLAEEMAETFHKVLQTIKDGKGKSEEK